MAKGVRSTWVQTTEHGLFTDRVLNILLVEDDQVDVMNVRRAFEKNHISNPLYVATNGL